LYFVQLRDCSMTDARVILIIVDHSTLLRSDGRGYESFRGTSG
jgi:hypothetical protein